MAEWGLVGWRELPTAGLCVQEKVPSQLPYQSRILLYLGTFSLC